MFIFVSVCNQGGDLFQRTCYINAVENAKRHLFQKEKEKNVKLVVNKLPVFRYFLYPHFRFDSAIPSSPLVFADQFLQLSTRLSSGLFYGLGEIKDHLLHNSTLWHRYALWAHPQPPKVPLNALTKLCFCCLSSDSTVP